MQGKEEGVVSPIIRQEAETLYRLLLSSTPAEQRRHLERANGRPELYAAVLSFLHNATGAGLAPSIDPDLGSDALKERLLYELEPFSAGPDVEDGGAGGDLTGWTAEEVPSHRYVRRGELGRGGMGEVYEVWDPSIERPLAMKVLRGGGRHLGNGPLPPHVARFLKEARITGQIDHPGVVPVHQIARDEKGGVFFTMQVVAGESLMEILRRSAEERAKGGWTVTRLLNVMLTVCETLAYAHSKGFVHRDLKPANVMVGQFGETYVMDWGLAKRIGDEEGNRLQGRGPDEIDELMWIEDEPGPAGGTGELTIAGTVMGTPMYMPPEQASGRTGELDFNVDVYAAGAMLYEVLAGHPPYADRGCSDPSEIVAAVRKGPPTRLERVAPRSPSELIAICDKAMARSRTKRYEGMGAMGDDIRAYLENRVVKAYQTGALAEFKKWMQRNKAVATAAGFALVLGVAALAVIGSLQLKRNEDLVAHSRALQEEKGRTEVALDHALSLVLAGESGRILSRNPAGALLLALEGDRLNSNASVSTAILGALAECREVATIEGCPKALTHVALSRDGKRIASATADHDVYIASDRGVRIALCAGHTQYVKALAFSPDDESLVSASMDGTVCRWDARTGRFQQVLARHPGGATFVGFSPDGELMVTGAFDGTLSLWDAKSGALLDSLDGHSAQVIDAVFSRRGDRLLSGSADGTARLWDVESRQQTALLGPHRGGVSRVEFSADEASILTMAPSHMDSAGQSLPSEEFACSVWRLDGTREFRFGDRARAVRSAVFCGDGTAIAAGMGSGEVRVLDYRSGQELRAVPLVDAAVLDLAANADGSLIAAATADGTAWILDAATGEPIEALRGHDARVTSIRFCPGGARVLTCGEDDTARLWRVGRGGPLRALPADGDVASAVILPGSRFVLTQGRERETIQLWNIDDGTLAGSFRHGSPVRFSRCSSDGSALVSVGSDGSVAVWSAADGRLLRRFALSGQITGCELSRDGRFLLTFSLERGIAERWDLLEGKRDRFVDGGAGNYGWFSGDGWRFAVRDKQGLHLWDVDAGRPLAQLEIGSERPCNARFSPCSRYVVTWPHTATDERGATLWNALRLWNCEDGTLRAVLPGHASAVYGVEFSAEGDWLVTSSEDTLAKLWDTDVGTLMTTFRGHTAGVEICRVTKDGRRVLTRCYDDLTTRLWDSDTGEEIEVLGRQEQQVMDIRFSSSGRFVVMRFARESEAALWSAQSGEPISLLPGGEAPVRSVEISDDERWVLTVSEDGRARVLPVDAAGFARQRVPRKLRPVERELYQVGTKEERVVQEHLWALDRDIETLQFLAKASDGSPDCLQRMRPSYRRAVGRLAEAMRHVEDAGAARAGRHLVDSLKTAGKGDAEAAAVIEAALRERNPDSDLVRELDTLKK